MNHQLDNLIGSWYGQARSHIVEGGAVEKDKINAAREVCRNF